MTSPRRHPVGIAKGQYAQTIDTITRTIENALDGGADAPDAADAIAVPPGAA